MATIDLGKIKLNWRGTWSSGTAYIVDDVVQYNKFPVRSLEQFNTFFKEKESAKKSEYLTEIEDRINDTSEESNLCTICYEEIDYMLIPHCCYQKFCYKCMVLSMLRGMDSVSDSDACCPMCRYKSDTNDDITFIKNERYENRRISAWYLF